MSKLSYDIHLQRDEAAKHLADVAVRYLGQRARSDELDEAAKEWLRVRRESGVIS